MSLLDYEIVCPTSGASDGLRYFVQGLWIPKFRIDYFLRSTEVADDCLDTTLPRDKNGYGVLQFRLDKEPVAIRTNRLSHELFSGPLDGLLACHTCHRTCCVHPDHIYGGTNQDNRKDRTEAGRDNFEPPMYLHLLPEMKRLRERGLSYNKIGDMLGVNSKTVWDYINKPRKS